MPPNLIVLCVDGLQASALGFLGNTWCETPHLDAWAAQGLILDQYHSDAVTLSEVYRGWWQGVEAIAPTVPTAPALPQQLTVQGLHTCLITDDPLVAEWAELFDEAHVLLADDQPTVAAAMEDTHMARLLSVAGAVRATLPQPFALWIHLQGLHGAWDAPYEYRAAFAEEEDPPPPPDLWPPRQQISADTDPDWLLGWRLAHFAQVLALDHAMQLCQPILWPAADTGTHSLLLSPRGFPLGLHATIGDIGASLYSERIHVPCVIRLADHRGQLERSSALVQPADLNHLLQDLYSTRNAAKQETLASSPQPSLLALLSGESENLREQIFAVSCSQEYAVRTPEWLARFRLGTDDHHSEPFPAPPQELFVKPEDRMDVNDVQRLRSEVLAELKQELQSAIKGHRSPG